MEETKEMNNIEEEQKSTKDHTVGEVTLEQFKNAIESNLEIKGYYDSVVDKTVNKRLDKSIESWKEKNLNQLIEEEVNKRYPQKTEAEIRFEEQQKSLEKVQEEKRQLELQIKYQNIMAENNLPMDILDFVAGKDVESTIANIERFKLLTTKYINDGIEKEVNRRFKQYCYVPPGENGFVGADSSDIWKLMK